MAGGNHHHQHPKHPSNKPSSSAANHRKPHREPPGPTTKPQGPTKPSPSHSKPSPSIKPSPNPNPNPNSHPNNHVAPQFPPPPPPAYGFHMLDRRTIVLADGSARSYFALPPDYRDFPPIVRPRGNENWTPFDHNRDQNNRLGLGGEGGEGGTRKRKFVGGGDDEFARQRQQLLQYGNGGGTSGANGAGSSSGRGGVDEGKVKSAFLNFVKVVNENVSQKKKFLADGKQGALPCLACASASGSGRSSKDFPDMHSLIMHTYNPEKATSDQVPDHLGLHKALCILMGWNYMMPSDNSKAYQRLSAEQAAADRDDLIMWPPHVIIHNTITGKGRDGRMEGLGNKAMDMKLRDFGFSTGKSKAMYGREGHMGASIVKFAGDQNGLKDALRLADFFEKQRHGRGSWASIQSMFRPGKDDEKDPNFVKLDKRTGEKERILYGYLGTAFDLEAVDFDTRKKVTIESKREKAQPT